MEVYILDNLYRRTAVVDNFISIIWTERFSAWGDFELDVHSTLANRSRLTPGVRFSIPDSKRVMTTETVEDATDTEGRRILKVKGRSFESIFESRLAAASMSGLTTDTKWEITDQPADIARLLFHNICVLGLLDAGDIIPGVVEANALFPVDTIDEPTDTITYSFTVRTLYQALKDLCDSYNMGFRLVRDPNVWTLYFDVYMGSDRTTDQTALPAVVFSPDLDNVHNTSLLTTDAMYKNTAYVISAVGHQVVYLDDVDPTINGFSRKVLVVEASDINDPSPTVANAQMIQRGKDELAKNRRLVAFDGEISQTSQYKYGTDYNLGDLVELRDDDGATSQMKVVEQIFVSDAQGDRSYPTLAIDRFVTPGSWLAMGPEVDWDDMTTEHWDSMP